MSTEPSLFEAVKDTRHGHLGEVRILPSVDAAVDARDAAIEAADKAADPTWRVNALDAIARCASRLDTFTTDDVWDLLHTSGGSTHEPRALGALMKQAAAHGVIEATSDWRQSVRPECHARPVRVWRSKVREVSA